MSRPVYCCGFQRFSFFAGSLSRAKGAAGAWEQGQALEQGLFTREHRLEPAECADVMKEIDIWNVEFG